MIDFILPVLWVSFCLIVVAIVPELLRRKRLARFKREWDELHKGFENAGPPPKKPHNCLEDPNCYPGKTMGKPMGNKPRIKGE